MTVPVSEALVLIANAVNNVLMTHGGTGRTWLEGYSDRFPIPAGDCAYKVRADETLRRDQDANVQEREVEFQIDLFQMLTTPFDSEFADQQLLHLAQQDIVKASFWELSFGGTALVYKFIEGPEVTETIERNGNLLATTITCTITTPP